MPRRSALATLAATAAGVASLTAVLPASASAAGGFGCAAGALSGSVLGQALAPLALAGDPGGCRTADGGTALPALLGAGAAIARTELTGPSGDVRAQRATSIGGVGALRLGAVDALRAALPAPVLPEGLRALEVPLPVVPLPGGTGSEPVLPGLGGVTDTVAGTVGSLLPPSMTIDALDAARALVPQVALPELLALDGATATATAACRAGAPVLDGVSRLAGLRVLGQELPTDRVVQQALTVASGATIPLTGADLSRIVLPAGLSFDDPVLGPVLRTAVQQALAALPPISVPGLPAEVTVTPGDQERSGDALVQRAGRVRVAVLGRTLADLALGEARVSATDVACGAPPVATASQLAVACAKRPVTLVDVAQKRSYVSLLGAVAAEHVGRRVSIVRTDIGKVVATGVVRPDGFFRTRAPLPPRAVRSSNDTRYQAVLDGKRSLALKLQRRMRISRMRNLGDRIQIIGRITGPLVPGQEIVIRRRESCTKDVVVRRFTPRRAGAWRVTLPAPTEGQAAVYRATTRVFGADETERRFPTFTLPGYVSL